MTKEQYEFNKKHKNNVKRKKRKSVNKHKKRINVRKEKHGE